MVFVVAIGLTFLFGYRAGHAARLMRWGKEPIHGWMNIPFIAHAHHVSPSVLYQALGVEPLPKDRRPLRRIARDKKRSVDELIQILNKAIEQNRDHPPDQPRP